MNPNINPQDGMPVEEDPDAPADWEAEYEDSGGGTTIAEMKVSDILNA